MKKDLKFSTNLLFVLLSWLLVGGSLYYLYQSRLQEFLDHQQGISHQGLRITSAEIANYFERRRHLLSLLVNNNQAVLDTLARGREDQAAIDAFEATARAYFSEFQGFALVGADAQVLFSSHEHSLGSSCRLDVEHFSQGQYANEIFVHSDPEPEKFHVNILARVHTQASQADAVLVVKLGTGMLQKLIGNGQPYNHNFYLVRRTMDNRYLIEMTAQGIWPFLSRSEYLTDSELDSVFAKQAVAGTRWQLFDFVSASYLDAFRISYRNSALIIALLYVLLSCVFFAVFVFGERRKLAQDVQIRKLNDTLENMLRRRTDQLEQSKQMLSYQSSHDAMTGLINRREFEFRLNEVITQTRENPERRAVLLYIDVDHIKVINETCGLVAGDEMLKQLSKSLFGLLRREDILARMGGDEFGVLLTNCDLVQADLVARTLREQIGQHGFVWEGRHFDISASIGVAEINQGTADVSDLLRQVDSACSTAKEQGRNQVHLYQSDDTVFQTRRSEMYWHGEAIRLINQGGIALFGQRIQPLNGGDGRPWYEVLVRLRDDRNELVYPDKFIPALEQYGGIEKLDGEITRKSIEFLSRHAGVRLNINLSGKSVGNQDLLKAITELIAQYEVDPRCLVFEITETVAMINVRQSRRFIESIKALGCKMALDDFGSGMSSFSYLKNLEVDYVKLDGSFVRNLYEDPVHYEMVRSINGVTKVMGRQCIAEFVENEAVVEALCEIGVAYAQGYHIHKPEPLENIIYDTATPSGEVDILLS